jgi:hypothetical protein
MTDWPSEPRMKPAPLIPNSVRVDIISCEWAFCRAWHCGVNSSVLRPSVLVDKGLAPTPEAYDWVPSEIVLEFGCVASGGVSLRK